MVATLEVVLDCIAAAAAAKVTLHSLLAMAVDERHAHNLQAAEVIVCILDLHAGCASGCSYVVFGRSAAGTTVGKHELLVRVFGREGSANAVQVVGEASAVVDS